MFRRLAVIGLFAMGVVALVPVQASAAVCLVKNGSTCVFWSGSVLCKNMTANQLGNVSGEDLTFECDINGTVATGNYYDGYALLVCGNPGSKSLASPGIQLVLAPLNFGTTVLIKTEDVSHNGVWKQDIHTEINQDQAEWLRQFCPNPNWVVWDYVPITMEASGVLLDSDGNPIDEAQFLCTLPDPLTLGWDKKTQSIEARQYSCCREGYDCTQ
jgi:hypothetical protein